MSYHPYTRIDNQYYQPWKVGDIVWNASSGFIQRCKVVKVIREFNQRGYYTHNGELRSHRRDSVKEYWLGPINKKDRTKRAIDILFTGKYNAGYSMPFVPIGHAVSADELYPRLELLYKSL